MERGNQLPRQGGFFWDELDAASGARGDWRRDPGGYDDDAGDVRSEVPGVARPGIVIA